MLLAGVPLRPALLSQLAALLDEGEPVRRKLEYEIRRKGSIVTLTIQERVTLLGALGHDPPHELRPLRDTLLSEFRQRETHARRGYTGDEPNAAEIHDA